MGKVSHHRCIDVFPCPSPPLTPLAQQPGLQTQIEALDSVERAYVHVDWTSRSLHRHKVRWRREPYLLQPGMCAVRLMSTWRPSYQLDAVPALVNTSLRGYAGPNALLRPCCTPNRWSATSSWVCAT